MKLANLAGARFKERPSDCVVDSHALLLRGGYIKQVMNGVFLSYAPLVRVTRKIEQILREEMDALGGQEVKLPVVMPASLWQASGRYAKIGPELARFRDRSGNELVLGMTHEEAAVQLVRDEAQSYAQYPFMIYQIQTKFRDEARPRAGLIRVREFTMKDAYSFHTSQQDLDAFYARCLEAYHRIFARVGLPQVVAVASDAGMMGGRVSHEFMLLTPIGEDSIALCPHCGYRANLEAAACCLPRTPQRQPKPLTKVVTPGVHTIEELCACLQITPEETCKAVAYEKAGDGGLVLVFLRGDLEVNETKLTRYLGGAVYPATNLKAGGLCAGSIGPFGLPGGVQVLYDQSLAACQTLACGANEEGFHFTGMFPARDLPGASFGDFAKAVAGGVCPACGQAGLAISRGIEVGNIFQLGDTYTAALGMTYQDAAGQIRYPLMGCYGIGVGRLAAAICEAHHDDCGPIWPMAVAPWQLHLCAVRAGDAQVRSCADALYAELTRRGVEVIYDDRAVSPGVLFADADLMGVPFRAVVSPRNCKAGMVEITTRDKQTATRVPIGEAADTIQRLMAEAAQ